MLTHARRRRRPAVVAGAALSVALAGCSQAPTTPPIVGGSAAVTSAPLPSSFYVDPETPASRQVAQWEAEGRTAEAAVLRRISDRPSAKWFTGDEAPGEAVDEYLSKAAIAGQTPVLVVDNIPERGCGRFGKGGAPTGAAYQSWIRDLASGVKSRPVIVILEPGAVPDAVDGCVRRVEERLLLLHDAVTVLESTGSAKVYLDAGHPGWIRKVSKLTDVLKRAGVTSADGFSLNVASFIPTEENVRYGGRVSDALGGGVPFVIDTSRNGNGSYPADTVNGAPSWCNPPGRALGEEPTDDTDLPGVDALLWIKYPGESDGACRPGEPEDGEWWPDYALDLARRSN